ncbi:MAG: FAD:protein FMN transferase [Pseudomonadota bacterium]
MSDLSLARRRFLVGFALSFCCVLATAAHANWHSRSEGVMGTNIAVQLWHEDEAAAEEALDAVIREMHRINALMSTWQEDTQLSAVNRDAADRPVSVSRELFGLIARALEFSELTQGAFDITYASVGYLYDYRKGIKPEAKAVVQALKAVDYRFVTMDPQTHSIRFQREGVRIDLGGIAKGYAVERGNALLRARGIEHAIVTAGGDSRILGDRRGRPWTVGIRNPRTEGTVVTRIPLVDEAISTSGDYERFFEVDGVRHHHILRPGTGESPREVMSVTIIGPDATTTDALSTGVFVLGVKDGLALIDALDPYETVIIDARGQTHYSSGLVAPAANGNAGP